MYYINYYFQVVGFDKVNSEQSRLDKLKAISVRDMMINDVNVDIASTLPSMVDLDISENLISSWKRVGELVSQVPLRVLNVSLNQLEVVDPLPVDQFSNLVHLIVGELNYTWEDVELLAGDLPQLSILQLHRNRANDIKVTNGKFLKLKDLDLNSNQITSWDVINNLDKISTLETLRLNENKISTINLPPGAFPNLKSLQMSDNLIYDWAQVSQLDSLPLTELRFRNNPVLEKEKPDVCRQIIIAHLKTITVLNGSTISGEERNWAEIDYYKKHGMEYLSIKKLPSEEQAAAMATFFASHSRYQEIVNRLGEPEEGELKVHKSNLKSTLISVKVRSPLLPGSADTTKKLPISMSVAKLKALIGRLFR